MVKKVLLLSLVLLGLLLFVLAGESSQDAAAQLEQAQTYINNGQYEQAEAIYQQIVTDFPDSNDALEAKKQLILIYIATDSQQQADAAFQELLANFSGRKDIAEAINQIAGNYGMKLKRYDKARELYQYVLEHYPGDEQAMWAQRGLAFADIHTGDYAAAEAAIEKLLADFPTHKSLAKAFNWLGNDYCRVGKYQRARELYQYVLHNWPGAEDAIWSQQGVVITSIQIGDDQTAESALGKLLSDFSGHKHIAKAVNKIADYYYQPKKYEKAREIYQYVVDNWPQSKQAIWSQKKVALLSIQLGDEVVAESATEKLLIKFSGHDRIARVVTDIADEYQKNFKKHDKALELYQHVLENWPDAECAIWAQKGLIVSHGCLGDKRAAEADIDKLLTQFASHKDIAKIVHNIANHCRELKEYKKAKELYEYIVDNWPEAEHVMWSQMGLVISNIRLGDYAAAGAAVEKLFIDFFEDERMAIACCLIADEYRKLEKHEKALVLYQYVVDNWPDAKHAMWSQMGLAISNTALKNDDAARVAIDKLPVNFSEQPKLPSAVFQIGELYYTQAFLKESENRHAQANQYFQKAITEWEKIITELPHSITTAWAYNFAADCYRRLGQHEKSIEYYQRVVDDWPDYEYAWSALFRIGRNFEDLKKSGLMSESEADPIIKAVYEQLLEKYPTCKTARHARHWLSRHK